MPKGAKKRAKLKKKQQQGHPDDGGNNNGSGSDNNTTTNNNGTSGRRDPDRLRIPPNASHADASEDSMESSEEMVTPRAAGSEADDDDRKAAPEVPAEDADQVGAAAGEEVTVDALPPDTSRQGKDDAEVEVHAVVQEPEVKDVVVDEPPAVQEPEAPVVEVQEVKSEVAKVHPVHEPELKVDEVVVVGDTPATHVEPEPVVKTVTFAETVSAPLVQEPEAKGGDVVIKDSTEVSLSREVDVHTTEVARGPAVAVAASGQRATWWNCCGLFDAFSGSQR